MVKRNRFFLPLTKSSVKKYMFIALLSDCGGIFGELSGGTVSTRQPYVREEATLAWYGREVVFW